MKMIDAEMFPGLKDYPTIEAEPVTWGKWIPTEERMHNSDIRLYECNKCKQLSIIESHYCPNCGAKMTGGSKNA